MFNSILKDHRTKTQSTRKHLDHLKHDALVSAEHVTQHLFHDVQNGVGLIYKNQRLLQTEASILQTQTQRFARNSERWLTLSANLNTALKELGDVHNWSLTLQKDIRWIESNLADVVEANHQHKIRLKQRREKEIQQQRQWKEEQERNNKAEQERRAAVKLAAENRFPPATTAIPPQQPTTTTSEHAEPVVDGEDEELP